MNDEIKEILTNLEDIGFMYKRISIEEIDKISDYITNLQQENERLRHILFNHIEYDNENKKQINFFGYSDKEDDEFEILKELLY